MFPVPRSRRCLCFLSARFFKIDLDALGRHCGAEVIALHHVAIEQAQNLPQLLRFHALGNGLEIEAPRHGNDGADDRGGVGFERQVPDEGDVYLQVVEGEFFEITERRIAGAEVVEGDRHAPVLELS